MHTPESVGIVIFVLLVGVVLLQRPVSRLVRRIGTGRARGAGRRERTHDFDRIPAYHNGLSAAERTGVLDERTWRDLDLDQVFVTLDRTESQPGQQYLYHLLRCPHFAHAPLDRLERAVTCLAGDPALADRVQAELGRLGDSRAAFLNELVLGDLPPRPALWWLFPILAIGVVLCLALLTVWPRALIALLAICAINIYVQSSYRRRVRAFIPAFHGLPTLLRVARSLGTIQTAELEEWTAVLRDGARALATLRRATAWLVFEPDETKELQASGYEYMNLLFLLDVNAFAFGIDTVRAQRQTLRAVFDAVGMLDAALSVARWRRELPQWCTPELIGTATSLDAELVAHPLLEAPVANSLATRGMNVLITGSNMSGKTTFVRTLGVNAVLAQTIHTVCAARWRAPFLAVRTSIGRDDSLVEGKSYYLAEVESVLALVRARDDGRQHLFLLDEIYRGTNTTERVAAARAVLAHLALGDDIVVVATHDLELIEMLAASYAPYHFREQIEQGSLDFDYRIRPGPSSTRNAIALLELMQYPESIVADALATIGWREADVEK